MIPKTVGSLQKQTLNRSTENEIQAYVEEMGLERILASFPPRTVKEAVW